MKKIIFLFLGSISFITAFTQYINKTNPGNVGIGVLSLQSLSRLNIQEYKLASNGDAMFTKSEIKPYTNWPDYDQAALLKKIEQITIYLIGLKKEMDEMKTGNRNVGFRMTNRAGKLRLNRSSTLTGGAFTGTINTGSLGSPAYYVTDPSGTVVDDFANVTYGTGNVVTMWGNTSDGSDAMLALRAANGATRFKFFSNGKLGFNTTSLPNASIEILDETVPVIVRNTSSNSYSTYGIWNDQNTRSRALEFGYTGSTYGSVYLSNGITGEQGAVYTTGNYPLSFGTNSAQRMIINASGNVGIGTTAPGTFKLAVEGTIGARKVIVQTSSWADYVFNDDYKLMSLKELDNYIQKNKHLPDVPSAKEVERNGVDLGDNQAVLLKKIEELTLYILDQQKQIDELKKEVKGTKK